jgi:hypothetical protein
VSVSRSCRLLVFVVVASSVGTPALAGDAGRGVRDLPPLLSSPGLLGAYQQVQLASSSEADALDYIASKSETSGFAFGSLKEARDELGRARTAVDGARQAGTTDAGVAAKILGHLDAAVAKDSDASESLYFGQSGAAKAAIAAAQDEKSLALSLMNYGDELVPVNLGCKLFLQQGTETFVGIDGCTAPVTKVEVDPWFVPTGFTDARITTGGTFPCRLSGETIECIPSTPLQPGQDAYLGFSTPAAITQGRLLAYGTGETAQVLPFLSGTGSPTADLALTANLYRVMPTGFQQPLRYKPSFALSLGNRYAYEVDVVNNGPGTAPNAAVQITLPAQFSIERVFPASCSRTSTGLLCPKSTLDTGYGGTITVTGGFTKPGAAALSSTVTSDAQEPSQDPSLNSAGITPSVYRIPAARIVSISPGILRGLPGTISGTVPPLSMPAPAELVTKVELGILRKKLSNGKCAWLNPRGG